MLVLSRKETERIRLGDSIVITVVRIGGDKVRLGIQAPKEMLVLRDELQAFEPPSDTHGEVSGRASDGTATVEMNVSLERRLADPGGEGDQTLSRSA